MKMKYLLIPFTLILITLSGMTSCKKKGDTLANIYVRDEGNAVVEGAMVVLYGTNTQNPPVQVVAVYDTSYTNAAGLALSLSGFCTAWIPLGRRCVVSEL